MKTKELSFMDYVKITNLYKQIKKDVHMAKYTELLLLSKFAKNCKTDILEIGAFKGLSTIIMAQNTNKYVFTIDPFFYDTKKEFLENIKKTNTKNIILLEGTTANQIKKLENINFDLIFIDGDHTYEGVLTDFKLLYPILNSNGLMVFHDSNPNRKKIADGAVTLIKEKVINTKKYFKEFGFCESITWAIKNE